MAVGQGRTVNRPLVGRLPLVAAILLSIILAGQVGVLVITAAYGEHVVRFWQLLVQVISAAFPTACQAGLSAKNSK